MTTNQKLTLSIFLTLLTITGAAWVPLSYRWIQEYFQFTDGYMFAPFMMLMLLSFALLFGTIISWVAVFDKDK